MKYLILNFNIFSTFFPEKISKKKRRISLNVATLFHVATSPHVSKTVSLLTSGMEEHNNMISLHPDTETCMIMIKWNRYMGIGSYEGRPGWRLRHRVGTDARMVLKGGTL